MELGQLSDYTADGNSNCRRGGEMIVADHLSLELVITAMQCFGVHARGGMEMSRKLITVCICCATLILTLSTDILADGFRGVEWGSSTSQALESEGKAPSSESDEQLVFEDSIDTLDCLAIYTFVEDQLVRGTYAVIEEHANKNDHIADYNKLKRLLGEKYGDPINDRTIWKDDLYKDDPDNWGMAIATSRLVYNCNWVSGDSEILLALYGDNYKINITLWYTSISLKDLESQKDEQDTESKL
jgi:hypothetical protein